MATDPTTPAGVQPAVPEAGDEPRAPAGAGPDSPADFAPASEPFPPVSDLEEPEEREVMPRHDLDELAVQTQRAGEYLELAQRTKADFENYRRRSARDAAAAQERGVAKLARELLPAVDNLDRALEATQSAAPPVGVPAPTPAPQASADAGMLVAGIKLVHAEVLAALSRVGIEPFSPEGECFDPQHHEAVAQQPVPGAPAGTVVEVYQRGYRLGDTVLRPARVLVAG